MGSPARDLRVAGNDEQPVQSAKDKAAAAKQDLKDMKVQKGDDPQLAAMLQFRSKPPPPSSLWDTDDVQYLDKVRCHAWIRMTHIDPKNGRFEGRIKAHWALRTLNAKERTEPRTRVPGLRLPRLVCKVEESRIWRHFDGDSERTVSWQGTTVLSFSGFEMFEVNDFPFDRQVINLDLFEFVWRSDKDSDYYFEAMKVVSFTTETISMLPEWDTYPAIIECRNVKKPGSGPSFGTRFNLKLRLQRKEKYYITQIFMVTFLILSASLLPLALAPGDAFIGDRLSLHSSGLLTLVAFKYGVSNELPSVPYNTFASTYLTSQIVTLVAVSSESVVAYKTVGTLIDPDFLNMVEDILLYILLLLWLVYFLHVAFTKGRVPWQEVLSDQRDNAELKDDGGIWTGPPAAPNAKRNSSLASKTYIHLSGVRKNANDRSSDGPPDTSSRPAMRDMLSGYDFDESTPDRSPNVPATPPRSQPRQLSPSTRPVQGTSGRVRTQL